MSDSARSRSHRVHRPLAFHSGLRVIALGVFGVWLTGCDSISVTDPPAQTSDSTVIPEVPRGNVGVLQPASSDSASLSIKVTPVFCCNPRSLLFDAVVSNATNSGGITFHWDFGDGLSAVGLHTEHTYAWPGDYLVSLRAEFVDGSVLLSEQTVSLPAPPELSYDQPQPPDQTDPPSSPDPPIVAEVKVIASAGVDREAAPGAWVILDGSASHGTGAEPLTFHWRQVSGTPVTLVNPLHSISTFLSPSGTQAETVLLFELSVAQGDVSAKDQIRINVNCITCPNDPVEPVVPDNGVDEEAIAQVLAGELTTANAEWWGFDATDATDAIQSAINSRAPTVVIPNVGQPWIVRPLFLVSNQEVVFEPGVVLMAKKGEFHGTSDCLLTGKGVSNVTIRGYDAALRMRKADYSGAGYVKSEFRHALSLLSVQNVQVLGLSLESSGGDGIFLGTTPDAQWKACRNVEIRDCRCHNNYRQGISVVSAQDLTISDCTISETSGTPPQAGIDLEPAFASDLMVNVQVSRCEVVNNAGTAFMVNLNRLTSVSQPVSITFSDCTVRDSRQPGLRALLFSEGPPGGYIEYRNCFCDNTEYAGMACKWNIGSSVTLRFVDCTWNEVAWNPAEAPINLELFGTGDNTSQGGIQYQNCQITDDLARYPIRLIDDAVHGAITNVTGTIQVSNPLIDQAVPETDWPLEALDVQLLHGP